MLGSWRRGAQEAPDGQSPVVLHHSSQTPRTQTAVAFAGAVEGQVSLHG